MGNKPAVPAVQGKDENRGQSQTAVQNLSATPIPQLRNSQEQAPQQSQIRHPQNEREPGKQATATTSGSTTSGSSQSSGQEVKKKKKLRRNKIPKPKPSAAAPQQQPTVITVTATAVTQTTQSVTGSDPNLMLHNNHPAPLLSEYGGKKEVTIDEQQQQPQPVTTVTVTAAVTATPKSTEEKPKKRHGKGKKGRTRTTLEESVEIRTAEKEPTIEAVDSPAAPGLAKRKRYKITGAKPKDENTEFERIKTKARPARQKKNSQVEGTKNLAKMLSKTSNASTEDLSLKSFEEEEPKDDLKTAKMEPTQMSDAGATTSNPTTGDATAPEKSAEATEKNNNNKKSDYL